MPLFRILALALLLQLVGIGEYVAVACGDDCAEQDCDDDQGCAPVCPTCHCAPRAPLATESPTVMVALVDLAVEIVITPALGVPRTSPDPRELLRPPDFA